jgi:hypothetical protein
MTADRIKEIQNETAFPDSVSVCQALMKVWNECEQNNSYSEEDMLSFAEFVATYPDKNRNVNGEILHAKSKYDGAERTIDLLKQFKKK